MQYTVKKGTAIHLGKQGEHLARELVFPEAAGWESDFGPGEGRIIFLAPGVKEPVSIVPKRAEDGAWLWPITAAHTARAGYGRCELQYAVGETVVKSAIYSTYTERGLGAGVPEQDNSSAQIAKELQLIDRESGQPYTLVMEGGRLILEEVESTGEKKPVVMVFDRAVPGGIATLGLDGTLSETQRPEYQIDDVPQQGSDNPAKSGGVYDALQAIKVEVDEEPTEESENPVSGSGVYAALLSKADKQTVDTELSELKGRRYSNPQLLRNARWDKKKYVINQRGKDSYTFTGGKIYGPDMWFGTNAELSLEDGHIHFNSVRTAVYKRICQLTELTLAAGQSYTVSVLADISELSGGVQLRVCSSSLANVSGLPTKMLSRTSGLELFSLTVTPKEDVVNPGFEILVNNTANDYMDADIVAWKLEEGPVQTLAYQDKNGNWVLNDPLHDPALELAKCQRYYITTATNQRIPASLIVTNSIQYFVPLPVSLRAVPTLIGEPVVESMAGAGQTGFAFSILAKAQNGLSISASKDAHGMTNATLRLNGVAFSAEL